ncbi:DUF6268 family outer membrane beta-barrel protein [Marinilabiliaceae bacterium ANBcel2]|nr:DUF6268 family outer membrane beta-barrel protein [Marinilabiliaceae bacterium ANBcel2]
MPNRAEVGIYKMAISVPVTYKTLGNENGALLLNSGYSLTSFHYNSVSQDVEADNQYHNLFFNFTYFKSVNEDRYYTAMLIPTVESDFRQSINRKNLGLTAIVTYSIQNSSKKSVTSLGLAYNVHLGLNYPFPVILYSRNLNNWSYTLGFQNELKYTFNDTGSLAFYLKPDGFRGYSGRVDMERFSSHVRIQHQSLLSGFNYQRGINEMFTLTFEAAYTLYNSLEVQDYNNNTIFDFGIDKNLYFGLGINLKSPF